MKYSRSDLVCVTAIGARVFGASASVGALFILEESSMEQVGIKGKVDSLGRIHIPKKIRVLYGMEGEVEMILTAEGLCLRNPRLAPSAREEHQIPD